MSNDTCRYLTCNEPTRDAAEVGSYAARFCSTRCELRHEHAAAGARDVRQTDRGYRDESHPEETRQ